MEVVIVPDPEAGDAGGLVLLDRDATSVATVVAGRVAYECREGAASWRS